MRDAVNSTLRTVISVLGFTASGDLLVFNDTRVLPARLYGRKETGGAVEMSRPGRGNWCPARPAPPHHDRSNDHEREEGQQPSIIENTTIKTSS